MLPCGYMLVVSDKNSTCVNLLVPHESTASTWAVQYSEEFSVLTPTFSDVVVSSVPRNNSFRVSVTSTLKRGRQTWTTSFRWSAYLK